jgi:hypothetical protein
MAFDPTTAVSEAPSGGFDPSTASAVKQQKIGAEGIGDAVKDVAGDFHPLTQMAVGGKALLDMAALKLKQGVGFKLSPEDELTIRANRALLEASNPALAGAVATGIGAGALSLPAANFAAARLAPALPAFLQPTVPAAVAGMTINAATTPTLPGESAEKAIQQGAVGGVLGDAAMRVGSRVIQPITQSQTVQNLLNKEIVPTPGQSAGWVMNRMEEKLASIPVLGDIVSSARNRARNELGTAAINLEMPKGMKVSEPGNSGIQQADDLLSEGYKRLYGNTTVSRDTQLVQDLADAVKTPAIPLSQDYQRMYEQIIKRDVLDRLAPGQTFKSADVKTQIEADLGKAIRKLTPHGQDGALRDALTAARQAVRDLAGRQAGVDQVARKALDTGYANVRAMDTAAGRSETNAGVPTPLQIINAAREGSRLEQLGRDAQSVLGNRVPNSGTTDRTLLALMIGGAGAAGSTTEPYQKIPYVNNLGPGFWLSLGAAPLLYSRTGARYMAGDLIPGQPALAQAMRGMAPHAANAGALYSPYAQ